ncbi:uncharacterized protein EKO05_0008787 [Ascochyta rabiei]|uniref:uncharacterized protein n=1 Tax=Didymella rabiei TaxID=5454 RepID=UPI0022083A88|nr:uncharacterized protein EKO05_0008787 [Ascochyta rabiei]UPX18488.1 hypothetical protein EKO05_0008787 [Ascochyta rabiei]
MMKINPMHPVRGTQVIFAIIVLGLMAYVSSWWTSHWRQSSPAQVSFLVFVPVWSLLTLIPIFLIPLKFSHLLSSAGIRWGLVALDALTMLFWFAGFVALAVFLNGRICFGQVCDVARAGAALGGLSWAVAAGAFGYETYLAVTAEKRRVPAVQKPDVAMHQGV